MWIDSQLVLDAWTSLPALDHYIPHIPAQATAVAFSSSLFSLSAAAEQPPPTLAVSTLVDVTIEYKHAHGRGGLRLHWYAFVVAFRLHWYVRVIVCQETSLDHTITRMTRVSAVANRFKGGSRAKQVGLAHLCTGAAIAGMPSSLLVAPGPPGDRSLVRGSGLSLASVGLLATLTVYARDRFGNNVSSASSLTHAWLFYSNATKHAAAVECLLPPAASGAANRTTSLWCTSGQYLTSAHILAAGAWSTQHTSQYAISYVPTISGHYSHRVQAFAPGGLQAHYFAGLSYVGPSIRARVDPELSFAWARQQDEVTAQENVPMSIRWTGLLRPEKNETLTLILRSSGGPASRTSAEGSGRARVYVQGKLVLFLPGAPQEEHARVSILGNQFVSLRPFVSVMSLPSPSQPKCPNAVSAGALAVSVHAPKRALPGWVKQGRLTRGWRDHRKL